MFLSLKDTFGSVCRGFASSTARDRRREGRVAGFWAESQKKGEALAGAAPNAHRDQVMRIAWLHAVLIGFMRSLPPGYWSVASTSCSVAISRSALSRNRVARGGQTGRKLTSMLPGETFGTTEVGSGSARARDRSAPRLHRPPELVPPRHRAGCAARSRAFLKPKTGGRRHSQLGRSWRPP